MDTRPPEPLISAGTLLLEGLEGEGLLVRAYYWRLLRPTAHQWALVVSLEEFGTAFEPGLSRLLDVWDEVDAVRHGLRPLDLWAMEPGDPEPASYARVLADRGPKLPCAYEGDGLLQPALLYRLPPP